MSKFRNPMDRPVNFKNPTGNVMKEIKEADLNEKLRRIRVCNPDF